MIKSHRPFPFPAMAALARASTRRTAPSPRPQNLAAPARIRDIFCIARNGSPRGLDIVIMPCRGRDAGLDLDPMSCTESLGHSGSLFRTRVACSKRESCCTAKMLMSADVPRLRSGSEAPRWRDRDGRVMNECRGRACSSLLSGQGRTSRCRRREGKSTFPRPNPSAIHRSEVMFASRPISRRPFEHALKTG